MSDAIPSVQLESARATITQWRGDTLERLNDTQLPAAVSQLAAEAHAVLKKAQIATAEDTLTLIGSDVLLVPTLQQHIDMRSALTIRSAGEEQVDVTYPLYHFPKQRASVAASLIIDSQLPDLAVIVLPVTAEADAAPPLEREAFLSDMAVQAGLALKEGAAAADLQGRTYVRSRANRLAFEVFDLWMNGAMRAELKGLLEDTEVTEPDRKLFLEHPYAMRVIGTSYADAMMGFDPLAGRRPPIELARLYEDRGHLRLASPDS